MPPANRPRRRKRSPASLRIAASVVAAVTLGAYCATAEPTPSLLPSRASDLADSQLLAARDSNTWDQEASAGGSIARGSIARRSINAKQDAAESVDRRKHVTFQNLDQLQEAVGLEAPSSNLRDSKVTTPKFSSALRYTDASAADADADPMLSSIPDAELFPVADSRQHEPKKAAGRPSTYNQDLVGKQTGNGYVFSKHANSDLTISDAGAALYTLFSRRDSPVSRPPLVPNSNSRLLIGLVIVCIIAVGLLTLAAQEMWKRLQAAVQPHSPRRKRSGDGRSTRTLYRSDGGYGSQHTNGIAVPSLEEEEERIKTPPSLSRRTSSAAASLLTPSPHNESRSDSDDEEVERKVSNDLHYLSLPFGIGIGYSYANIADGRDARMRISRIAAKRSRSRSSSTLALSSGALPIAGTTAVSGTDGLRSRTRSFKELCRDAFVGTTSRDIGVISEEEGDGEMTAVSTPRWGSSLVSFDLPDSDRGSGAVTPTGPSVHSTTASGIALEDLATQSGKGRYFGAEGASSSSGHTLIDLGLGAPEIAVSDPVGITRPASTPGVMPSQVARHPQVEQLRREGRSETGKRVGKGTPTNAKLH